MKTIGERINLFENGNSNTVKDFNDLFNEVPLTGFGDSDIVSIGDITKNTTTRLLLINDKAIEHSFVRRTQSENSNNLIDDDTDPDWLFYFV